MGNLQQRIDARLRLKVFQAKIMDDCAVQLVGHRGFEWWAQQQRTTKQDCLVKQSFFGMNMKMCGLCAISAVTGMDGIDIDLRAPALSPMTVTR